MSLQKIREGRKQPLDEYRATQRRYRQKLKVEVLSHYCGGEPRCMNANCLVPGGCRDLRTLSIDHIKGNGADHFRKIGIGFREGRRSGGGLQFYIWLKKKGFPEGFQVLCMNCQFIKREENHEYNSTEVRKRGLR